MKQGLEKGKIKCTVIPIFLMVIMLAIIGCGGNIDQVYIINANSTIYTKAEIDMAIEEVIKYFKLNYNGCTLKEIRYAGDVYQEEMEKLAEYYGTDKAIILLSSFETDTSGGDGSLNPNTVYKDWKWILIKDPHGKWKHVGAPAAIHSQKTAEIMSSVNGL